MALLAEVSNLSDSCFKFVSRFVLRISDFLLAVAALDNVRQHTPRDIRQAEIATAVAVGQAGVIDA